MEKRTELRLSALAFVAAAISIGIGATPASADKSLRDEAMAAKLFAVYHDFKTLKQTVSGKMEIDVDGVKITVKITSALTLAQPNRFRIETTAELGDRKQRGVAVSDGKTVWEADPETGEYSEQTFASISANEDKLCDWLSERATADMTPMLFLAAAGAKSLGVDLRVLKTFEVKDYPTQSINGKDLYVVPLALDKKPGGPKVTLYVTPDDMLVRRCRYAVPPVKDPKTGTTSKAAFVLNYSDIVTDKDVDAAAFTFEPAEGAKKVKRVKTATDRVFE